MIQELFCYFDLDKNICCCGAKGGEHEACTRHFPTSNGRPCSHLRPDQSGRCDNAYACFEAYALTMKPEQQKGDQK